MRWSGRLKVNAAGIAPYKGRRIIEKIFENPLH